MSHVSSMLVISRRMLLLFLHFVKEKNHPVFHLASQKGALVTYLISFDNIFVCMNCGISCETAARIVALHLAVTRDGNPTRFLCGVDVGVDEVLTSR